MNTKALERAARRELTGQHRTIRIGNSSHTAFVRANTRVKIIPGSDAPPELKGQPYLKTGFRNGTFSKILYTPSTLHIRVGENWRPREFRPAVQFASDCDQELIPFAETSPDSLIVQK